MLSYRHGFHAGNHADVLKHLVLSETLRYLTLKPAPIRYVDTHAGPGRVALDEGYSLKTGEAAEGIGRLWTRQDLPEALAAYVDLVRAENPSGQLLRYPGSPRIAAALLRERDGGFLFELHPADETELAAGFEADPRFRVFRRDGLSGLRALVPPPARRALVLIDPPYERDDEYGSVVDAVDDATRRFPSGCYAVWYPILSKDASRFLPDRILSLGQGNRARVELRVKPPSEDAWGMRGSGLVILNPPWTLKASLEACLPYLARILGTDGAGAGTIEWMETP